ncbi:MAG: sugar ABC transporter permease [Sedimentisphaerales bacterium]
MSAIRKRTLLSKIWEYRHFYLFISPFFILFAVFGLYPLIFSMYLSFVEWDGLGERKWVGFNNFINMFYDDIFFRSLWNTIVIGIMHIPPMFIGAFLFALILNASWLKFRGLFRAAFFLPCVTPMVVIAIVFMLLYGQDTGFLNYLIVKVGALFPWLHLKPIGWLVSEEWSKPSIAVLLVWRWTGYNMVLMLAGLQGISQEYYEAAKIDGASAFQRMLYITLPLMRPIFVFCGIMSLIGTVFMFDEVFVLTAGGPGISSTNFGLYLFNTSFIDFRFGRASAMAYTVALVVLLISLVILKFRKSAAE